MVDTTSTMPHGSKKTIIHVTKTMKALPKELCSGKQYGDTAGCEIKEQMMSSSALHILADIANTHSNKAPFSTVMAGKSKAPACSTPKSMLPNITVFDVSDAELFNISIPNSQVGTEFFSIMSIHVKLLKCNMTC